MPFGESFDCVNAFDMFAAFARFGCETAGMVAGDAAVIAAARRRLAAFARWDSEVLGARVQFCPLLAGTGLVPAPRTVLLDDGLRLMSPDGLAEVLAHEFEHVQQFETMGASAFKCAYVRAMNACGGCQDRGHPLERVAYETQDRIRELLLQNAIEQQQPHNVSPAALQSPARPALGPVRRPLRNAERRSEQARARPTVSDP
jgi:hypothetical protein